MEFNAYEGICKYCGAIIPIMAADQKDADLKVSADCDCGGFKKEKQHKDMAENITKMFGEKAPDNNLRSVSPNQLRMIVAAAESVFAEDISSISIGLFGAQAKISRSGKGNIKIVRAQAQNVSVEV